MKKNVWKHVLTMILAVVLASSVTACASKETTEVTEAPREEKQAPPADTEETKEVVLKVEEESSYLLSILEDHGDGTYSACDKNGAGYRLTLSSQFPEKDTALLVPQAILTVTALAKEHMEQGIKKLEITSAQAAEETLEGQEAKQAAFEKIHGFHVDESISASMYASSDVNVRKGPSTDYEKTGSLSFAQEVTVTGMADTGWYQISYNGESAYVSGHYLTTEKPSLPAAPAAKKSPAPAQESKGLDTASLSLPYTEAEIDAAMNSGDLEKAWAMNQANLSALSGSPSTGTSPGSMAGASTPMEKNTSSSGAFVSYLNSQRVSAGLSELAWSDSLAATAQARAEEIVNDFSHNGSRNCSGEIITQSSSSDETAWYANFYNSPGHRAHMLDEGLYTRAGAAACHYGDRYYVVVLFDYTDR